MLKYIAVVIWVTELVCSRRWDTCKIQTGVSCFKASVCCCLAFLAWLLNRSNAFSVDSQLQSRRLRWADATGLVDCLRSFCLVKWRASAARSFTGRHCLRILRVEYFEHESIQAYACWCSCCSRDSSVLQVQQCTRWSTDCTDSASILLSIDFHSLFP